MACGLKKQSNQEGGVHLTERTCSPYNPIIKLIVDDCLGLPIYPVSSIDAVIDEDGKTLRQLLDELTDEIKGGTSDIQTLIENIQNKFELYLSKTEFNTFVSSLNNDFTKKEETERLKSLLWAISALSDTATLNETKLYTEDGKTPTIVYAVKKLQDDLAAITNGGSGLSLLGLSDAIKSLKGILLAVANYNEEYTVNSNDPSGLEPSRLAKIKIIQEIIDIKSDINGLSELIGGNPGGGGGSITLRVKELETQVTNLWENIRGLTERVDALEEEAKGHAHLDTKVLDLMPADFGTDNQIIIEKKKSLYKTLKISEYPPTSAKFLTYAITSDTGLYYLGFLPPVELNNRPDFYPFGHTDSSKGYPLFYVTSRKADGSPAGYAELTAAGQPNKQLYAGDGTISGSDYVLLIKIILEFTPEYASTPDPSISENLKYNDLYIKFNENMVPVGNVNLDDQVNIGDVNTLINTYNTNASSHSMTVSDLPATYSKNLAAGYLLYQNPTANSTYILYPCILGKVYVDTLTGNAYRYSDDKMYPVAKDEFVGSDGILIKKSVLFTDVTDDENLEGPYNLYKISIADDTLPNTITCKYINDLDAIDNELNFEYFLYEGLYLVIPSLNWDLSNTEDAEHVTIDSSTGTVTVTNNISSVTSLIDVLLGSNSTISLKETIGSKKQALTDWVNSKLEEALLLGDALKELKLTKIKKYLTDTSNTHTSAPSDPIKVYYGIKIGSLYELRELSDLDPYYERLALKALWDFDQNGSVNISDITSLIDSLLNTKEETVQGKYSLASDGAFTYITPIALGANIWKKIGENKKQVVPAGSGSSDGHEMLVDGRLFRVIHPTQNVNNLDWYYFDDNDVVRPINPKLDLDYSSATGYLSLHQYGVEIDNTQISTTGKNFSRTTSLGETYEIRNLGKNSTPYLFGTWLNDHLSCFLNPDKSVIKDAKVSVTMDDISRIFSVDEILDKSAWFDKNDGNIVRIQPSGLTFSLACPDVAFTELEDYSMFKYVGSAPYTSDFTEKIRDVLEKHIKSVDFSKSAAEITAAFNEDNEYTLTYWGLGPEGYLYKVLDYIKVTMSEEALSEILSDNSEEITNEVLALILLEAITLNANLTIIDSEKLDTNTIYYFPKFGLQIRFEVEQVEEEENTEYIYHPVIVQVESKEYDKNHVFSNFTEGEAPNSDTLRKKAALVYPNEYLDVGRVDSIYFDCGRLENIPGFKYIDAHGLFIANTNNMSLTLGSSSIGVNNSNPEIKAKHFYEYHIFNGVFSFKDISTFNPASAGPSPAITIKNDG